MTAGIDAEDTVTSSLSAHLVPKENSCTEIRPALSCSGIDYIMIPFLPALQSTSELQDF